MSKILVVIGSARVGRVADTVSKYVQTELAAIENISVTIADLKEINLPFFDNDYTANPDGIFFFFLFGLLC